MTRYAPSAVGVVLGLAAHLIGGVDARAARLAWQVTSSGSKTTVVNAGPRQAPNVTITSQTLGLGKQARHTVGPTLNGVRVAERMLSHARLSLRFGSGTARLEYDGGFAHLPSGESADTLPFFNKYQHDFCYANVPLVKRSVVYDAANARFLRASWGKHARQYAYPLVFGDAVRVRQVHVSANPSNTVAEDRIIFSVSTDPRAQQVVAEKTYRPGTACAFTFGGLDHARLYLTVRGNGKSVLVLRNLKVTAWLDISRLAPLVLESGQNELVYTDDTASSHHARIEVDWMDGRVVDDLEGAKLRWAGRAESTLSTGDVHGCARGRQCLRATFTHPDKAGVSLSVPTDRRDWSTYQTLHLSYNMPKHTGGQIAIGMASYSPKYIFCRAAGWLRQTSGWKHLAVDLRPFKRHDVRSIMILKGIQWAKGMSCTFYVDDIWLSKVPVPAPRDYQTPAVLAAIRRNLLDRAVKPAPRVTRPAKPTPAKEFFPMGPTLGGTFEPLAKKLGVSCWDVWGAVLDDLRRHHQTSAFVNNSFGSPDDRIRLFRLAEARGMRLYWQGPVFYKMSDPRERRLREWQRIKPAIEQTAGRYRNEWGLLAWSHTEEIPPQCVPDLAPYETLMRRLDPPHPCIVIHNNKRSITRAAEVLKPPVLAFDVYPVLSWYTTTNILRYYEGIVDHCYQAASPYGARVWILPQAYEEGRSYEGSIGYSRRWPTPAEMKMQGWCAVAHGATGLMPYFYGIPTAPRHVVTHARGGYGYGCLKTLEAADTPQWNAWGEACAKIGRVAPLLVRIRRTPKALATSSNPRVELVSYQPEPGRTGADRAGVLIAASNNPTGPETFAIRLGEGVPGTVWDLLTNQALDAAALSKQDLPAGSGRVYLVGTQTDHQRIMSLLKGNR